MKPVVLYRNDGTQRIMGVNVRALVTPIDHPSDLVSNTGPVLTSPVIRIGTWGEFETLNTIYRPNNPVHDDE